MGGTGYRSAEGLTLLFLILNGVVLAGGLALEHWRAQPKSLPEFNASQVRPRDMPAGQGNVVRNVLDQPAEPVPVPPSDKLCLHVTGLSQARYGEMKSLLAEVGVAPESCAFRGSTYLGWWVYWPAEYEASQRQKVLKALRAAGVKDVQALTKGPMAQGFALGFFAEEGQSLSYRDSLRSKGLEKVEQGPRPTMTEIHLVCKLPQEGQRNALRTGLPEGVTALPVEQCPY